MELKKSSKADLERKKNVFMQIGFVMVLSVALIAFEWSTTDYSLDPSLIISEMVVEEEIIPITRPEEIKPPPPPPPQVTDVLVIVDDDVELDDVLDIFDTEMDNTREFDMIITIDVEDEERDVDVIHIIVEDDPEFPGGNEALLRYLAQNTRYPPIAQENGIQGKVHVRFVVEPTGDVSNVEVIRGVDPSLDREAVRVVSTLPRFKPGRQRNRPVRVWYTVPINFTLQN